MTAVDRASRAAVDQLPDTQLYTSDEVSAMTGHAVGVYWLEQAARDEKIPARKVGRAWRWSRDDILALFEYCLRMPKQRTRR